MGGGEGGTSHALGMEAPHFQSPWWVCATGDRLQRFTLVAAGIWFIP